MSAAALAERPQADAVATVESAHLAKAMRSAASIIASTNTIPILSNVKLTADPIMGKLEIISTDMDTEFRQLIPLSEGSAVLETTVDARRLAALAGAAPAGAHIRLKLEEGRLVVSAGRSRWVLPVLPAKDFPVLPIERLGPTTVIEPASRMARAIDRVIWSAHADIKTRPYFCGFYMHEDGGRVRLAANNGHTMASDLMEAPFPSGCKGVIVPTKFANTLKSLTDSIASGLTLSWDERKVRAEIGTIVLTGKVIDYEYPEYQRIIPQKVAQPIIVDPETLRAAAKRVLLINDLKSRAVRMDISNSKLSLSTIGGDTATALEEVPADTSATAATGFNGQYLTEALAALGGDSIEIHQDDPGAPALFRRVVDDGAMFVVMPMRV